MSEITMKNEIQPDDFEVSEKADDAVSEEGAYQAPEEISSELFDYTVSFDGALYQIPAPVSEYIANGWKLVERESDILIESQKSGKVTLTKDGQTFETYVKNDSESTEEVVRCLVTNLTANVKDCDVEMEISDGIHMGMSQANLEAAIAAYEYKKDTSSYIYYEITNPEQEGSGYEIIVKDGIVTGIEIALKMK